MTEWSSEDALVAEIFFAEVARCHSLYALEYAVEVG